MTSVLVMGSTGMLGSTVTRYLSHAGLRVIEANRSGRIVSHGNSVHAFDVLDGDIQTFLTEIEKPDYIINCVGLIKQKINPSSYADLRNTIIINSQFPVNLAETCETNGSRLIQIATDCVFSGSRGNYSEKDQRDPTDVYGYSKALGEIHSLNTMTIRCSIIGHELDSSSSLLNWVLSQELNSEVRGFTNHYWNGLTTFHFAKACEAIINNELFQAITLHFTPKDSLSKYELIKSICREFGRSDIVVREFLAEQLIDRRLTTTNLEITEKIWECAGYKSPPTLEQMIQEYAEWNYNA